MFVNELNRESQDANITDNSAMVSSNNGEPDDPKQKINRLSAQQNEILDNKIKYRITQKLNQPVSKATSSEKAQNMDKYQKNMRKSKTVAGDKSDDR